MCINPVDVELAYLYYVPKAHQIGTPLRPIISFNTTVVSCCEIIKQLYDCDI
jgi:hypothetical protein